MSLLAQINQRNADAAQQEADSAQQAEQEASKPDAMMQTRQQRQDYANSLSAGQDVDLGEEPPTPEEQEKFTALEGQIVQLVNGPRAAQLFKIIDSAADPVEGIGQAANDIVKLVQQQDPEADGEILMALGESAVEQLVQTYEEVRPEVDLTEDQMAEAYSIGLKEWMDTNPQGMDSDMQSYLAGPAPTQLEGQGV